MRAMALVLFVGCAHQSPAERAAVHAAELAVCRQLGANAAGDGAAKWRVYSDCADKADAKARAK